MVLLACVDASKTEARRCPRAPVAIRLRPARAPRLLVVVVVVAVVVVLVVVVVLLLLLLLW